MGVAYLETNSCTAFLLDAGVKSAEGKCPENAKGRLSKIGDAKD